MYAGSPKDDEYLSYAVRYVEFVLSDPIPDRDHKNLVYDALRDKYIKEVTDWPRGIKILSDGTRPRVRFDKAIPRHIERIFDTGLIIEE